MVQVKLLLSLFLIPFFLLNKIYNYKKKMRTISLVKRLKWNFSGNMNPHALVIGDVDNDNVI